MDRKRVREGGREDKKTLLYVTTKRTQFYPEQREDLNVIFDYEWTNILSATLNFFLSMTTRRSKLYPQPQVDQHCIRDSAEASILSAITSRLKCYPR